MTNIPRAVLTDAQWEQIEPLLPVSPTRPYISDHRTTVEGILWIARTGAPWRDLPERYGKWITVYQRFRRWTRRGVFARIHAEMPTDLAVAMADGTFVKAHQHAAGARRHGLDPAKSRTAQALGTSRGGLTSKIVALTDTHGRVARFTLVPGNAHEVRSVETLLPVPGVFMADRAYDSRRLRDMLGEAVIPSTRKRRVPIPHDEQAYKARHLVENAFADIKQFRGIATRYCKLADTFSALVQLVCWVSGTRRTRRGPSPHMPF